MELFPADLLAQMPDIGADPELPLAQSQVFVKYKDPGTGWRWYLLEFDGVETFFGFIVNRHAATAGQFTMSELSSLQKGAASKPGLRRDPGFEIQTVKELSRHEPGIADLLAESSPREVNLARGLVQLEE